MIKYIFWIGLVISSLIGKAQKNYYNPLGSSGLSLQLAATPNRNIYSNATTMDSAEGTFGFKNLDLSAQFVLYKKVTSEGGFRLLNLVPFYSYQRMQLGWLLNPQHIIRTGIRASGYYAQTPKHIWMIQGGAFASNDDYTIYHPTIRYQFNAIYHHKSSEKYAWSAGLWYNYNFGRGLWIPLVNFDFKVGDRKRLRLGFPSGIQYAVYKSVGNFWTFSLSPRGQVATLTNQFGEFNTQAPTVQLRGREILLNGKYIHPAGKQGRWFLEAGLAGRRKLSVSDAVGYNIQNFKTATISGTFSFRCGYAINFSLHKKTSSTNIRDEELEELMY